MVGRKSRWTGMGAALALSVLTLFVFSRLQFFGPDSAVRRFHEAAVSDDRPTLQSVTLQQIDSPAVGLLREQALAFARAGALYQPLAVHRRGSEAFVEVAYVLPARSAITVWVADRRPDGWKVNADATVRLFLASPGR